MLLLLPKRLCWLEVCKVLESPCLWVCWSFGSSWEEEERQRRRRERREQRGRSRVVDDGRPGSSRRGRRTC